MATETTGLLSGYVIDIPRDKNEYEDLCEWQKTKSLSLEELMPFQDDPWWQNIRRTFFLSFWITLMIIFTSACIISILEHGSCDALKNELATGSIMDSVTTISNLITSKSA